MATNTLAFRNFYFLHIGTIIPFYTELQLNLDGKIENGRPIVFLWHVNLNIFFRLFKQFAVKLGAKTVERFFSLADDNFIEDVNEDLKCFLAEKKVDSVLVFPPLSNYRRFLIHRSVERLLRADLVTFSIGCGDARRTVVCYRDRLLSDEACARPAMGLTQEHEPRDADPCLDAAVDCGAAGGCRAARAHAQEKIRSSTKPRRPDRAVYVPRALRAPDADDGRPPEGRRPDADGRGPKSPAARDRATPGTPRRSLDKHFCNVYTPPHLRTPRSQSAPGEPGETPDDGRPEAPGPTCDSAIAYSDNSCNELDVGENFYIGDYFANGQLGFYRPSFYDYDSSCDDGWPDGANDPPEVSMAATDASGDLIDVARPAKDEDGDANELKRASQEINRSSKRIIKQSFDSDVLVISEPAGELEPARPRVLRREDNDWEAVFDDSGECLDPSLLEELAATVGRVTVSAARRPYAHYEAPPAHEAFAHVLEVYDFPSEFKTNDLLALFSEYKDTGFEIKWVDDTHALIVFSSAKIAAEALARPRSLARCRPLHAATLESRAKAKKCAEFLQPYRQRPETCAALARRLVSGALGVRLSTASQERAEERRLITRAREKKRQAALHREAAWDGSLANTTTDTDTNTAPEP